MSDFAGVHIVDGLWQVRFSDTRPSQVGPIRSDRGHVQLPGPSHARSLRSTTRQQSFMSDKAKGKMRA